MKDQTHAIEAHYTHGALQKALQTALQQAGRSSGALTVDDLAPLDEFHIRGREATAELLAPLGLDDATRVLDVGCGIGGTGRFIAATYGSTVTGVDLSAEYCQVATALTQHVGLEDRVRFLQGNALRLPVADATYDVVVSQHMQMNVRDKQAYAGEVARVLKPGGRLALYEICAGAHAPPYYPVPWAEDPSISFLAAPGALREALAAAGLDIARWKDATAQGKAWFTRTLEKVKREGPPPLGLHLLMGANAREKMQNVVRNLSEHRIVLVMAVARKPPA